MAETKKDTSSKRWYLQGENRMRHAGIAADGTIPEIDREALHRLISVKLAATGFEVPETSTQDEGVMQLASDLFRQYAEQVSFARMRRAVFFCSICCAFFVLWAGDSRLFDHYLSDSGSCAIASGILICFRYCANKFERYPQGLTSTCTVIESELSRGFSNVQLLQLHFNCSRQRSNDISQLLIFTHAYLTHIS